MKTIFIQKTYKSSRTVSFDVPPQEILTKDSVTVAVDAVVYYKVPYSYICYIAIFVVYYKLPRNLMSLIMNQDKYQIINFHPAPRS